MNERGLVEVYEKEGRAEMFMKGLHTSHLSRVSSSSARHNVVIYTRASSINPRRRTASKDAEHTLIS